MTVIINLGWVLIPIMMTMNSGCSMMTTKKMMISKMMVIVKMIMCFLANYMTDGIIKKISVKMLGKSFIETGKLVNILSFLGYLPCAFPIYLIKQKMDYLSHFLDLIHLVY